jgi:predicted Zn-dependent peptidase
MEERRMRNDSSPVGRLWELTMATAFLASPYHNPVIGYESDIQNLTASEANDFFKRYYTPDRAVGAIVGDIDVNKTIELLRQTFGKIPARNQSLDGSHIISEPPQQGERDVKLRLQAQPTLLMGWHKPSAPNLDDVIAEALEQVLTGGRSSRWYEEFVKQKHLAADLSVFSGPGDALPNLIMIYATPQEGVPLEKLEGELRKAVARLRTEPVSAEELTRAKKNLRADTIRALEDNMGLASRLAESAQIGHDPYYLERRLRQLETVTPGQIQEFVTHYMTNENLTVGALEPPESPAGATGAAQGAAPTTGTATTTATAANVSPATATTPTSGSPVMTGAAPTTATAATTGATPAK